MPDPSLGARHTEAAQACAVQHIVACRQLPCHMTSLGACSRSHFPISAEQCCFCLQAVASVHAAGYVLNNLTPQAIRGRRVDGTLEVQLALSRAALPRTGEHPSAWAVPAALTGPTWPM